jgi:CBS domain-containing protein
MSSDLCTAERGAGFYEAADLMAEHGIRRLPVCEDDSLVGIITADDLNELLADEQQKFAELIRAQRPAY